MYPTQHPLLQLGIHFHQQQNWQQAEQHYLAAQPEAPLDSLFLQGHLAYDRGELPRAQQLFEEALETAPKHAHSLLMLGNLTLQHKQPEQALKYFRQALDADPEFKGTYLSLAVALESLGKLPEAAQALQNYLQAFPKDCQAWNRMNQICHQQKWYFLNSLCWQQLIQLEGPSPRSLYGLMHTQYLIGHHEQQPQLQNRLEKLLYHQPALCQHYQSRCLFFQYAHPQLSDLDLLTRMRQAFRQPAHPAPALPPSPTSTPYRIGFICREFRRHSWLQIFLPFLKHRSQRFVLIAYDDQENDHSECELKSYFEHWKQVSQLSNQALAAQLQQDQIDICVDLGGLTHADRFDLYSLRPAAIQVTGLAFLFNLNHPELDYYITDQHLCPPELSTELCEKPIYLSSAFHWDPLPAFPLAPPPSQQTGQITLGSANALFKLNSQVLQLWSKILKQLPTARLRLKSPAFQDKLTIAFYQQLFNTQGIAEERIELLTETYHEHHLQDFYSQIDIALDPFPYQGAITTMDALWMGVPVISLFQPQWQARSLAVGILKTLGLEQWVASSESDYINKVCQLASQPQLLQSYRYSLRERVSQSIICDGPRFAREVEAAFERMLAEKTAPERDEA